MPQYSQRNHMVPRPLHALKHDGAKLVQDTGRQETGLFINMREIVPGAFPWVMGQRADSGRPRRAANGAGPMLINSGGTPTVATAATRASALIPRDLAYAPELTSAAAAPSTMAELFPPVCTPPKAGRIFANVSYDDGRT